MKQLIKEVYDLVKDYRADEGDAAVIMTECRIEQWIEQFEEADREFILTEMKNIFGKRYCTKEEAKSFLIESVEYLQKYYAYATVQDFLLETVFLNMQRRNKSQPTLLRLLKEVLLEKYKFDTKNCGTRLIKNYVYLDDILCTGNTLYQDIYKWVNEEIEPGQTYLSQLQAGNIRLIFLYIFIHEMNYQKKLWQFRRNISENFGNYHRMVKLVDIENGLGSRLEIMMPSDVNQLDTVHEYQQRIEAQVAKDCLSKNIPITKAEFYRPHDQPRVEEFFTSVANRKRLEDIFLHKGIEILTAANVNKINLRALGFALPTHKNFGFGTLCVTWRNVPNNCPLVFWYAGGGFFPLFVKNQT